MAVVGNLLNLSAWISPSYPEIKYNFTTVKISIHNTIYQKVYVSPQSWDINFKYVPWLRWDINFLTSFLAKEDIQHEPLLCRLNQVMVFEHDIHIGKRMYATLSQRTQKIFFPETSTYKLQAKSTNDLNYRIIER